MTLRVTEISGGLSPCRTGERRAVYPLTDGERRLQCGGLPPAGRGNAGGLPPCRTGERRYWNVAVYPPPPARRGNAGRFTPCRTGNAGRFTPLPDGGTPIWNVAVYPLPDGGTSIWNVAVYPLPDGGTPIWIVAVYASYGNSQPPLPTSSQNKCDRILWMQCARQGA